MKEITTTDFSKFGSRERKMARELLQASEEQGFPEEFCRDEITIIAVVYSSLIQTIKYV